MNKLDGPDSIRFEESELQEVEIFISNLEDQKILQPNQLFNKLCGEPIEEI